MEQKKFLTTFAIFSLVAGCCVMVLLYPMVTKNRTFIKEPGPEEIGTSFFTALANAEYQKAFDLCDGSLQEELGSAENLQAEIEKNQFQPSNWKILTQRFASTEVEYSGSMDYRIHISGTFRITLRQTEDGWRVAIFFLDY